MMRMKRFIPFRRLFVDTSGRRFCFDGAAVEAHSSALPIPFGIECEIAKKT